MIWITCEECGYTKQIPEREMFDANECPICKGIMSIDTEQKKELEEPTGDNYPALDQRLYALEEQEVKDSFNMIGVGATWQYIETINDIKLRLQYRKIFFLLGGKIPKRTEN
jgi:hypothetical protein